MLNLELEKIASGPALAKDSGKKEEKKDDPSDTEFEVGYTEKEGAKIVYRCRT